MSFLSEKRLRSRRTLAGVVIVPAIAVIAYFSHSGFTKKANAVENSPTERINVFVKVLQPTEMSESLVLPAIVAAEGQSNIFSAIEGNIRKKYVQLGDHVRAGQPLFSIESSDPLRRYQPLIVSAPIRGSVAALPVRLGDRVDTSLLLATIVDTKDLRITAEMPDISREKLQIGLSGLFEQGTEQVPVKVFSFSRTNDPRLGTSAIEFKVDRQSDLSKLTAGRLGRVRLVLGARQGLLVPDNAVIRKSEGDFVAYIDPQQVAHHLQIKIVGEHDSALEISGNDLLGKTLIVQSPVYVGEGDSVQARPIEEKGEGT